MFETAPPAEWTVMHEEGNCTLFPFYFFVEPWGLRLQAILGQNLDMLVVIRDGRMKECVKAAQYEQAGRRVFESLPESFVLYMERTDYHLEKVRDLCDRLEARTDWSGFSDDQLLLEFSQYCEAIQELNTWGMMVTLMEYADSSFISGKLLDLVSAHLTRIGSLELPTQVISRMTTPFQPTFYRLQRLRALELSKRLASGQTVDAGLSKMHADFAWLAYGYEGPALGRDYFESEVRNMAAWSQEQKNELHQEETRILKDQADLASALSLPADVLIWLGIGRQFMFKKEYRKQLLYRAFFAVEGLQKELAKRAGLSLRQLRFFTPDELPRVLSGEIGASEANERMRLVAYSIEDGVIRVLTGPDAVALESHIIADTVDLTLRELSGQCAYSDGRVVRGTARIVMNADELSKLQSGDILVSHSTNPNMLAGMKIAGAILTDQGGITCHAAIVSRELKISCVTGLKKATLLFKDGDILEVDAAAGVVRKSNP